MGLGFANRNASRSLLMISVFCKTLRDGEKIVPYKLYKELKLAFEYGLKYIYIKNAEKIAKFETSRIIQLLEDWNASNKKVLYINFPAGSKGMNFKRK